MKRTLKMGDEYHLDCEIVLRNIKHESVVIDGEVFIQKVLDVCKCVLDGVVDVCKK